MLKYYLTAVKLKGGGIAGEAFDKVELECETFAQADKARTICQAKGYTCSVLAQVRARKDLTP